MDICDKPGLCLDGQRLSDIYLKTIHEDEIVCKSESDKFCTVKEYIIEDKNKDKSVKVSNGFDIDIEILPSQSSRGLRVTNP